jgi:hypothetical protein
MHSDNMMEEDDDVAGDTATDSDGAVVDEEEDSSVHEESGSAADNDSVPLEDNAEEYTLVALQHEPTNVTILKLKDSNLGQRKLYKDSERAPSSSTLPHLLFPLPLHPHLLHRCFCHHRVHPLLHLFQWRLHCLFIICSAIPMI